MLYFIFSGFIFFYSCDSLETEPEELEPEPELDWLELPLFLTSLEPLEEVLFSTNYIRVTFEILF